ncbi:12445_t:CDS:2 [Ambispora leptoticha]|uniref:12445_t:CDS:1 n=1 Tax=Ambispora leptoticha TaxID=144679 RepID=A0A9N9GH82_9GLOM|nr:12445_t:CDS:2 [Ambispora leptoticha]
MNTSSNLVFKQQIIIFSLLLIQSYIIPFVITQGPTCMDKYEVNTCSLCQFTLFSLGSLGVYDPTSGTTPNKCDQKTLFLSYLPSSPSPSTNSSSISNPVSSVSSGLDGFCASKNNCDEETAVRYFQQIQQDCDSELANKTDEMNAQAVQALKVAYFSVSDRMALCEKNSNGDYCAVEILNNEIGYLQTINENQTILPCLNSILPPNGQIAYNTSMNDTNSTNSSIVNAPDSILCDSCYTAISNIYINWTSNHPLNKDATPYISQNMDELKSQLISKCGSSSVKVTQNNTNIGPSNNTKNSSAASTDRSGFKGERIWSLGFMLVHVLMVFYCNI